MAVLKSYVADSNTLPSKIITLDEKYDSYLQEAAQHKSRAKTVKESFKRDVYTAKQGQAVSKMKSSVKLNFLNLTKKHKYSISNLKRG